MDDRLEEFSAMLDIEAPDIDCDTAMIHVRAYLDADNVSDMLKLVARHPKLNLAFWKSMNSAPTTDADWERVSFIGSGGREGADRAKALHRRAVEIVRQHLDPVSQRRDQLFRR